MCELTLSHAKKLKTLELLSSCTTPLQFFIRCQGFRWLEHWPGDCTISIYCVIGFSKLSTWVSFSETFTSSVNKKSPIHTKCCTKRLTKFAECVVAALLTVCVSPCIARVLLAWNRQNWFEYSHMEFCCSSGKIPVYMILFSSLQLSSWYFTALEQYLQHHFLPFLSERKPGAYQSRCSEIDWVLYAWVQDIPKTMFSTFLQHWPLGFFYLEQN